MSGPPEPEAPGEALARLVNAERQEAYDDGLADAIKAHKRARQAYEAHTRRLYALADCRRALTEAGYGENAELVDQLDRAVEAIVRQGARYP